MFRLSRDGPALRESIDRDPPRSVGATCRHPTLWFA